MSYSKALCLLFVLLLPTMVFAYDLQFGGKDYGKLDGQVKGITILYGEDNGYDPNEGTAYLLKLKYLTPSLKGFQAATGLYVNGDLFGLTDWDSGKVARGLFVDDKGDDTAQLGEIYAQYKAARIHAFGGRMLLDTPLTKNSYSTIPNFYTAFGIGGKPFNNLGIELTQITQMSFGARAMTDFGLIGEGTGTAGATVKPNTLGQAEFHSVSKVTLGEGAPGTNGITAVSMVYSGLENTTIRFWDYYAYDIDNNIYFDIETSLPVNQLSVDLGFQYLRQDDIGDALADQIDFNLLGLKAGIGGTRWTVYGAFNTSFGDTDMLNAWGGDPAYTSTIFSRNAYRKDVNAWGFGGTYRIIKGLMFLVDYFDYGKSESIGKVDGVGENLTALNDAHELDLTMVWKPKQVKGLMLKIFYANRTSEYNGSNGKELTQSHWRIIAAYNF